MLGIKRDVIVDPAGIKWIIKGYREQLYSHQFDGLEKMDHFLKKHEFPQFTQYETENLNGPVTMKEMELIIFNSQKEISRPR